jgi:hypothetical protein
MPRRACALLVSEMETADDTGPVRAIALMVEKGELVTLPRPVSGTPALTIADRRRLAACAAKYRTHDELQNAQACIDRIEEMNLPAVLDRDYVRGPTE